MKDETKLAALNTLGNYFVIDVPHQLRASGYWADDVEEDDDLSSQIVCETVGDLKRYTVAIDNNGCATRHQAARVAALAESALDEILEAE